MNNSIYPCLWFDGKARQAADLYIRAFTHGRVTVDTPLVVNFEILGKKFMGLNGGPQYRINPSVSFFVYFDSVSELDTAWEILAEKGSVMMPLDKYPWSEKYGWCQDPFGVNWQLMIAGGAEEKIVPALFFTQSNNGKADEAIHFYTTVFKNSSIKLISRYEKGEPDTEGNIKHAQFTLNGQLFIALESSGPHMFTFTEGVSIFVSCESQEEIDYYWTSLTADGGKESRCGWLKDKYGLSWQIVPSVLGSLMADPVRGQKVMQALLPMKKIEISVLEKAAQ